MRGSIDEADESETAANGAGRVWQLERLEGNACLLEWLQVVLGDGESQRIGAVTTSARTA